MGPDPFRPVRGASVRPRAFPPRCCGGRAWREPAAACRLCKRTCTVTPVQTMSNRIGREGQDSTIYPKLKTWEFDQGRPYLDEWASDGKPYFSRKLQTRIRVLKVVLPFVALPFAVLGVDYGPGETVFSPIQRAFHSWWSTFTALDHADIQKAHSVGGGRWMPRAPRPPAGGANDAPASGSSP